MFLKNNIIMYPRNEQLCTNLGYISFTLFSGAIGYPLNLSRYLTKDLIWIILSSA